MPETTETQMTENKATRMTKEERAAKIREHVEKHGVEHIPASNQQAENATLNPELSKEVAEKPARVVSDKTFRSLKIYQAGITAFVTTMTFRDVADYCCYARSLYTVDDGKKVDDFIKEHPDETWQRNVTKPRLEKIGEYLTKPMHFLPPILTVPASAESVQHDTDGNVTVTQSGLGVLDGQHRYGGILKVLGNGRFGSEMENETIPVVVLLLDDLEVRQQIFADINSNGKTVSKALNLLFDNRDEVIQMAKRIADDKDFASIINMSSLIPKKSDSYALSFTNLHNFVKRFAETVDSNGQPLADENQILEICKAVINAMPDMHSLRTGNRTYGILRNDYGVAYSSTAWQALGQLVKELMLEKHADGTQKFAVNDLPQVLSNLISSVNWQTSNKRWQDSNRPVVVGSKVLTQTDAVKNCTAIVKEYLQ